MSNTDLARALARRLGPLGLANMAADLLEALEGVLTYADPYAVPGCDQNEPKHKKAEEIVKKARSGLQLGS